MLEIRQSCENCDKPLANNSNEAMICTYECTYCIDCVNNVLRNVCPNCGGGFERRPIRPKEQLKKHPPREDKVLKPVKQENFIQVFNKNKNLDPRDR